MAAGGQSSIFPENGVAMKKNIPGILCVVVTLVALSGCGHYYQQRNHSASLVPSGTVVTNGAEMTLSTGMATGEVGTVNESFVVGEGAVYSGSGVDVYSGVESHNDVGVYSSAAMYPNVGTTTSAVYGGEVMATGAACPPGTACPGGPRAPVIPYYGPRIDMNAMDPNAWSKQRCGYTLFSPVMDIYSGPVAGTPGAPMMNPFYGPLVGPMSQMPAAQPSPGLSDGPYVFRGPRDYRGDMNKMPRLGP